ELVKYLTQVRQAGLIFSATPARKSLANAPAASDGPGPNVRLPVDPEAQKLVEQAVANGLSVSDLRYGDYLGVALQQMKRNNLDASAALRKAEAQAVSDQAAAVARKGKSVVLVATPVPVNVAPGKTTLKFGLTSFIRPIPFEDKWQQLARDFANSDS